MQQLIENYLHDLTQQVYRDDLWQPVQLTESWADTFSRRPGVLVFREQADVCYIGETNNLRNAVQRLVTSPNHTLRGKLRRAHQLSPDDAPATNRALQSPDDRRVDRLLEDHVEVLPVEVLIGRTELKERLIQRLQPVYNLPGNAKALRVQQLRQTYPNAFQPWTEGQESELADAYGNGATVPELVTRFGRQRGAILARLRKLERRGVIVA